MLHIYSYQKWQLLFLTALLVGILLYLTARKYAFYLLTEFLADLSPIKLHKILRSIFFIIYIFYFTIAILSKQPILSNIMIPSRAAQYIWKAEFAIQPQVCFIQYLANSRSLNMRFYETGVGINSSRENWAERERRELLRRCELQIKKTRRGERS